MKYKVGDKVRIVSEKIGCDWDVIGAMDKWLGKIMTISEVDLVDTDYQMAEDDKWFWTEEMIEGLVEDNKMEQVAQILGVKLDEEFSISSEDAYNPYKLTNRGLLNRLGATCALTLSQLVCGELTIKRVTFKPNYGEVYYCVEVNRTLLEIIPYVWTNRSNDYCRYNDDNCFKTKGEITREDKDRILKETVGKYNATN